MSSTTRIPYVPVTALPEGVPPLNIFRMWAHSPETLEGVLTLGAAVLQKTSLSPEQRELLVLLNATRVKCEYQWGQHVAIAKKIGVPDAKVDAIAAGCLSGEMWDEQDEALLAFLDEVIREPVVSDEVFARAKKHFSDQALVEIVTSQVRSHVGCLLM